MRRFATNPFVLLLLVLPPAVIAQTPDPYEYFEVNCVKCHTIGGGWKTGPDLKNVSERRPREWLLRWLQNPEKMLSAGDPVALRLKEEAKGAVMPNFTDMTPALAASLLDMIAEESKLEESRFLGLADVRPMTAEDAAAGLAIFTGARALEGGGPACLGCHAAGGVFFPNGGTFGPDLTKVFERRGGRDGLAAWMTSVAHDTVRPLYKDRPFTDDEIHFLVSFLRQAAQNEVPVRFAKIKLVFLFLGLVSAAVALLLLERLMVLRAGHSSAPDSLRRADRA